MAPTSEPPTEYRLDTTDSFPYLTIVEEHMTRRNDLIVFVGTTLAAIVFILHPPAGATHPIFPTMFAFVGGFALAGWRFWPKMYDDE